MQTRTTQTLSVPAAKETIDTSEWRRYFESNRGARKRIDWSTAPVLSGTEYAPLVRSLQRFQLGETGDGKYLKKFAAQTGDADYITAIDLFISEEQEHAALLAKTISAMQGTLIHFHWSNSAFVVIRRLCGLRTEVLTLQIAEVIGKAFYEQARDHVGEPLLAATFGQMVTDEIAHIRFHAEYIRSTMDHSPRIVRNLFLLALSGLFFGSCLVFVVDHRSALRQLDCDPADFFRRASNAFQSATRRALRLD